MKFFRNLWIAERFHERKLVIVHVDCAVGTPVRGIKESFSFFVGSDGQPGVGGARNGLVRDDRGMTYGGAGARASKHAVDNGIPGANRAVLRGKNEHCPARLAVFRYGEVSCGWTDVSHYAGRSACDSCRAVFRRRNSHNQGLLYTGTVVESRAIVAEPERARGQRRKAPGVDQARVGRRRNPWLI